MYNEIFLKCNTKKVYSLHNSYHTGCSKIQDYVYAFLVKRVGGGVQKFEFGESDLK